MNFTEKLQSAYKHLKTAERVLIISHTSPDADALASIGAMHEISLELGLEVYAFAEKKATDTYNFIPLEGLVYSEAPDDLRDFGAIIILDCGSLSRTGLEARIRTLIKAEQEGRIVKRPYIIEFDHHEPQETYADLEIRLTDKAATTEIIYHFLKANNIEITKTLATCLLIGLLTDTGHFLHANSSRESMSVAAEMLLRGAALSNIIRHTIHNKSFLSLKIWGRVLENLHFNPTTGLASSGFIAAELEELAGPVGGQIDADLFGDIASFLCALSGVRVALLLREDNERVKGSLRTTSNEIDVSKIAQNWGGGGHQKAAGFTIDGRLMRTENGWKVIKS